MLGLYRVRQMTRRLYRRAYIPRWRGRPFSSDAAPIVVGGCPRSGTTLIRVILDTHPHVCCGPESGIFLPGRPGLTRLAGRFDLPENTVRALFDASPSHGWFIDEFFKVYCAVRGKPRWAEKTPGNVNHLDFIFQRFPRARFVHMLRDGRDAVCSLRTHPRHAVVDGKLVPLNTHRPIEPCVQQWVTDVQAGLRYRGDPRYMEIRYEALVQSPRVTLERLFAFLDEPFDERVLDFHAVQGRSRDVTNFPQNPEATRPLYSKAVSRWQSDLTAEDIATFKRVGGRLLIDLGYATGTDW